ncbi:sulfate transporter [Pilimelia anulata]|uniref:Sulfate transporter n=1 Tax=Pilimelia anulata TaxID=53371 RepID=A0A8J3BBI7_9ACTN|nr:SulP family inorganic anion transporter [Pilimelia anulata]GGK07163.1 sulfate transporter [Pilimelia anulata]
MLPARLRTLRYDLPASLVVFLVALPLCVGVAVASGVPAELGLITGIVGGLVAGALPGSALQVSGPAAGLTVLVFECVRTHGLDSLGITVLAAGVLQVLLGLLRFGRWFRAISVAVVEGMLAGIGLVLILGQVYALADRPTPDDTVGKLAGLPGLVAGLVSSPAAARAGAVGLGTLAVILLWPRLPGPVRRVPGVLVAIALATAVTALAGVPVATLDVSGLWAAVRLPDAAALAGLADPALLGTVLAFALIASAESLFSAAAVDRMHRGRPTDFDRELVAQGTGNVVCGAVGALPMTAVIVRSAANVRAGARTRASRVLHGAWLLLFAALLPAAIGLIPIAALAAVLLHAGAKLLPVARTRQWWREQRGEAVILLLTAAAILATNMFEGILVGLAAAVFKTAWDTSRVQVVVRDEEPGPVRVTLVGSATFLRLPQVLERLETLPKRRTIDLHLSTLRHLDHATRLALEEWAATHNADSERVRIVQPI